MPLVVLVFTRGDEVVHVDSIEQLTKLLVPIESAAEAYTLLTAQRYEPTCTGDFLQAIPDGFAIATEERINDCPVTRANILMSVSRDGTLKELERKVLLSEGRCVGRRPAGLRAAQARRHGSALGCYFAAAARLEAASVPAFARLGAELQAHGAPRALVHAARRAGADEVRHVAMMTRLAHRYGGVVETPRVRRMPARSVRAFAIENAREGCVRETWGALEAAHQARHAIDPVARRTYLTIAADEARHAALAWQVASWVDGQLGARDRRVVRSARDRAVRVLADELGRDVRNQGSDHVRLAGVPTSPTTERLLASLRSTLWV